ncbi:MAG: chemotaxis-specific protein-glutamate methyltransferase CheB [Planctomycetes bacterium]|nr:chemotaxis-specific protein-glutamate methyltransferase CheB [Planctomycetota bacterium]
MTKIRILIVDDSSTTRLLLTRLLSRDPNVEVIATAADGQIALSKLEQSLPDLVLLDVEMPQLDGLATLKALREKYLALPVIMFSRLTMRGAAESVEALFLGADDYVAKPASSEELDQCIEYELLPRIRSLAGMRSGLSSSARTRPAQTASAKAADSETQDAIRLRTDPLSARVDVVTIAASTGGPAALATLLAALAPEPAVPILPVPILPVPILIVQHISAGFTTAFAERLAQRTGLDVKEARADQPLSDAHVWIAAGDHHMFLAESDDGLRVRLNQAAPEHSCRPAANVLFRSAAEVLGAGSLGVVLTGMGVDGLAGSQAIVDVGGHVIVQDEASSVVWGMPGSVAKAGLADAMFSPVRIGREVRQRLAIGR